MAVGDIFGGVFSGVFSNSGNVLRNTLTSFMWGFGILVVVGIIAWMFYRSYKNKTVFTFPVTLTRILDNGVDKTRYDLRGGLFINKGIRDFKIKIPKQRKPHILGYIPDFSKSSSVDGRLHFITSGDGTVWQQYSTRWITKEVKTGENGQNFEYDLIKIPVSRETKQVTVNSIKNWRETVDKSKLTAFGIAIGAFIVMVIAHLISLFIQTRIRCPTS